MRSILRCILPAAAMVIIGASSPALAQQPKQPPSKLPSLLQAKPIEPAADDDELDRLLKARYNAALAEVKIVTQTVQAGRFDSGQLMDSVKRLVHAGVEAKKAQAEKIAFLEQYVEWTKETERLAEVRVKAGVGSEAQLHQARYLRLDAEIMLVRAKPGPQKTKAK